MQWKLPLFAKTVLVISMLGLLSACGFHLRGVQNVDEAFSNVTLIDQTGASQLTNSLRSHMAFNGINETSGAPYQIRIIEHNYKRESATVSNTDVDEYELSLAVVMLVADKNGKPLTSNIKVQRERLFDYDKNTATASGTQEQQLRNELYDLVAQSMIRRYLALKTTE
ncbi:MAG: LPS assembly lipoprotein LptE [Neptuniibacter sp.]